MEMDKNFTEEKEHNCVLCNSKVFGQRKDILCLHCRIKYMANYVSDLPKEVKKQLGK